MKKKSYVGIIFRKEMIDILRDRRSLLLSILLPIVLYPAMLWIMGSAFSGIQNEAMTNTTVAVEAESGVYEYLLENVFAGIEGVTVEKTDDADAALRAGDVKVALRFGPGAMASLTAENPVEAEVIYDQNKSASSASLDYIMVIINTYNSAAQERKLAELGISLENLTPLHASAVSLAQAEGEEGSDAGMMLSMMLPMMMVILLSVGGMATAVDIFAGEKDRRTFEPLLCTRAKRTDILTGKMGAVVVMSLVGAVASLGGMVLGYVINPTAMTMGMNDVGSFSIPASTLVLTALIIIAMALFFSGLHVLLATWSRTAKEASTYGSFIMIACYVPVFGSMYMQGGDFTMTHAFIPVMNTVGCLKMVLAGIADLPYMLATLGTTAFFVIAVLIAGRWMFGKESIMMRA